MDLVDYFDLTEISLELEVDSKLFNECGDIVNETFTDKITVKGKKAIINIMIRDGGGAGRSGQNSEMNHPSVKVLTPKSYVGSGCDILLPGVAGDHASVDKHFKPLEKKNMKPERVKEIKLALDFVDTYSEELWNIYNNPNDYKFQKAELDKIRNDTSKGYIIEVHTIN